MYALPDLKAKKNIKAASFFAKARMTLSGMPNQRFRYVFGGVILDAGMPLEGGLCAIALNPPNNNDLPLVTIDYGKLPERLDGAIKSTPLWQASDNAFLYAYPKAGRFMVVDGKRIVIERGSQATDWNVVNALVRAPLGAALHQLGRLVLHASAIKIENKCYIFMGNSSAGKSTLAAYMVHQKGFGFLTDEICALTFANGKVWAHAASPELRLFNDSKDWLELAANSATKNPELPKNHIDQHERIENESVEVAAIYNLCEPRGTDLAPRFERVVKRQAIDLLKQHTYRKNFITGHHAITHHFKGCASVVNKVPMFDFCRRKNFTELDESMSALIDHAKSSDIELPA